MAGVADVGIPASDLVQYSQGLGTFTTLEGELTLLDGKVYRSQPDGSVHEVGHDDDDKATFVMATKLAPDTIFRTKVGNKDTLQQKLEKTFAEYKNMFIAYRARNVGKGWKVKIRIIGGQQYSGQSLSEVGDAQKLFEYDDVQGEIVGFTSPSNWQGVSVAGEHMHFLSNDRKYGGHVLELEVDEAEVQAAVVSSLYIDLPKGGVFNNVDLMVDDESIRKCEGS